MAELRRTNREFDLQQLGRETLVARQILDFQDGPYGNCISLPTETDVSAGFREHHNNLPFSGALHECTYFKQIFDSFPCEKAAFRLLRRAPKTAYALHDDRDKGMGTRRFQIPITTNEHSFMLIADEDADFDLIESEAARVADEPGDIWFDLEKLDRMLAGHFELFSLPPGFIYYFDTEQIHTLINAGDEERIVLSMDLVVDDWLTHWMETELTHLVAPAAVERNSDITWQWNALRNGLIRNA